MRRRVGPGRIPDFHLVIEADDGGVHHVSLVDDRVQLLEPYGPFIAQRAGPGHGRGNSSP